MVVKRKLGAQDLRFEVREINRFDEDAAPNPARQFRKILHEGPALGIHCLLWCDSYNTLNRFIDRQGLEDLEMRVVFQMNANDSSHLIDSPLASQLGVFRAYFYSDADGRMEKFRPYGPPTEAWLQKVRKQLQGPGSGNEGSGFRVQGSG